MSSGAPSAAEVRELVTRLGAVVSCLERVESSRPSQAPAPSQSSRGSARHRGLVALGLDPSVPASEVPSSTVFPGIPDLASLWTFVKPAGPPPAFDFSRRNSLEGPPGLPDQVFELIESVSWAQEAALHRVQEAFNAGFWGRLLLSGIRQTGPVVCSEPAKHFVVLRAAGLGGYVRFASAEDFNLLVAASFSSDSLVASGFATEAEVQVYCFGASIALPPLDKRCQ